MSNLTGLHDEHGNPVAGDQHPPNVDTLPFLEDGVLPFPPPAGIEARTLHGRWAVGSEEIVLWHPQTQFSVAFFRQDVTRNYPIALNHLLSAIGQAPDQAGTA